MKKTVYFSAIILLFNALYANAQCSFSYEPLANCNPLEIEFSIDNPSGSYTWNFGDGNMGSGQTTTNTYAMNGSYTVSVLQGGNVCESEVITVNSVPANAFTVSDNNPCGQTDVTFSVIAPAPNTAYQWDFGDGSPVVTGNNVIHAFPSTGTAQTYTVTLTENGVACPQTEVVIVQDSPDASIEDSDLEGDMISFTSCDGNLTTILGISNTSSTINENTSYLIDWGDMTSESLPSGWTDTTHTYMGTGYFTITVTAIGPFSCTSSTATYSFFNGSNTNPDFNFIIPTIASSECVSEEFIFGIEGVDTNPIGTIYTVLVSGDPVLSFTHPPPATFPYQFEGSSCGLTPPGSTYENAYEIELQVSNPCLQASDTYEPIRINGGAEAVIAASSQAECVGTGILFTSQSISEVVNSTGCFSVPIPQTDVSWNIDPPVTGWPGDMTDSVTFDVPGDYTVTVYAEACGVIDSASVVVSISAPPIAGIMVNQDTICTGESLTFNNTSSLNSVDYQWTITDSNGATISTSTDQNFAYTFNIPDTYTVQMIAENSCTSDTISVEVEVVSPMISVPADTIVCETSLPFIIGTATPSGGLWSGTGIIDPMTGLFNPALITPPGTTVTITYTYTDAGTMCVNADSLEITVDAVPEVVISGLDTLSYCVSSTIIPLPPATPSGGDWTDESGNPVTEIPIDAIGDNIYIYTFTTPGGCVNTDTVTVTVADLIQAVALQDATICEGESVQLAGMPAGGIWSGNGVNADGLFTGNNSGIYDIIYQYETGTCATFDTVTITVIGVDFTPVDDVCALTVVDMNMYLTLSPALMPALDPMDGEWSDTDGTVMSNGMFTAPDVTTNTTFTLTYTYDPTGLACSNTVSIAVIVNPIADFDVVGIPCIGEDIDVLNYSTDAQNYTWEMGDGTTYQNNFSDHVYLASGAYVITLTASDGTSLCSNSSTYPIFINEPPVADFIANPLSGCSPVTVSLTNNSLGTNLSYEWDYDNGTMDNTDAPPNETFDAVLNDETYNIILTLSNVCGTDSDVETIDVEALPVANFSYNDPLCGGEISTFEFEGYGNPAAYDWSVNGNSVSTDEDLIYTFPVSANTETYDVMLVVTNNCGTHTYTEMVTVSPSSVNATFDIDQANPCESETVQFTSFAPSDATFDWAFGDGDVSTDQNPNHAYLNSGTYDVTLTVSYECGANTSIQTVVVNPLPQVDFDPVLTGCVDTDVLFNNTSLGTFSSFLWDFGDGIFSADTNPLHPYMAAGIYTVTLTGTDDNGCENTVSDNIEIFDLPDISFMFVNNFSCADTIISFTSMSMSTIVTYAWDFGDGNTSGMANPDHDYENAGIYTVTLTVTDENGCDSTVQDIVNVLANPVADFSFSGNNYCNPDTISFINNSTNNIDNLWDFGDGMTSTDTNPIHIYTTPGTYLVTLTATNGDCIDQTTQDVIINETPIAVFTLDPTDGCPDLTVSFTNMSSTVSQPIINYSWNFGDGTNSFDPNPPPHIYDTPGIYTLTLTVQTDFCENTFTEQVEVFEPVEASLTTIEPSCDGNQNGNITTVITNGTPPYIYNWDNMLPNNPNQTNLDAGTYTITITDSNGCSTTLSTTLTNPQPITISTMGDILLCFGDSDGQVIANPTGGTMPYTYIWDNGVAPVQNPTGLPAGIYNVTVTDANACTATAFAEITQPTLLTVATTIDSPLSCNGDIAIVTATASGGTAPYTYDWDNLQDISNPPASAGTYNLSVTDSNGCTATATATITEPTAITAVATGEDLNCFGDIDGDINLTVTGGTQPYTYLWNNLDINEDPDDLGEGVYTVVVTDANGCETTASGEITEPPILAASATGEALLCFGDADGDINLTVTGGTQPYTYLWNNLDIDEDPEELGEGIYTVVVTDANMCTVTASAEITTPTALSTPILIPTEPLCNGDANGSIDLTIMGGTSPYFYNWDNSAANVEDPTGLSAGTYNLTITDSNGCPAFSSVTIGEPDLLQISLSSTDPICNGGNDGTASVSISGGTAGFDILWSNGATGTNITGLAAGTYFVTITDNNNCTAWESIFIDEPDFPITYDMLVTDASCNGLNDGSVELLNVMGGISPYTYAWNTGGFGTSVFGGAGNYAYVITDANGCEATGTAEIMEPAPILPIDTTLNPICSGDENGMIIINGISGGTEPYQIGWTPDSLIGWYPLNGSYPLYEGLAADNYTLYGTDSEGCPFSWEYALYNPPPVSVSLPEEVTILPGDSVQLDPFITLGGLDYQWYPPYGLSDDTIAMPYASPLETTVYILTVEDDNGCSATDQIRVIVDEEYNIYIPNVFSPNFDGPNDVFMIYGDLWTEQVNVFRIYDRWGELLWEAKNFPTDDPRYGWDGTIRGKTLNPAVFVYYAEVTFINGVTKQYEGNVTLVK